jgi:hypothetical protein
LSAIYQACLAPISYGVWRDYVRNGAPKGEALPIWLWPVAIAYLAVPAGAGLVVAHNFIGRKRWAISLVGPTAAPTAWDAVFRVNKQLRPDAP